jgi:hypothetical protein
LDEAGRSAGAELVIGRTHLVHRRAARLTQNVQSRALAPIASQPFDDTKPIALAGTPSRSTAIR